jgi:predicted secreted protein
MHASAVLGRTAVLWVTLCAVLSVVADATVGAADATVGAADAAGANARPPQVMTAATTAAAPIRRPVSLLFSFMFSSPSFTWKDRLPAEVWGHRP